MRSGRHEPHSRRTTAIVGIALVFLDTALVAASADAQRND
jgi:hypothetical protein